VDRELDLFEKLPDGSILWRDVLYGKENAIAKLRELAALSPNEFMAVHVPSREVVASANIPKT